MLNQPTPTNPPDEFALIRGHEYHMKQTEDIEALIERLRKDLQDYRAKHQQLSPGQKIHVEIREKIIHDLSAYIDLTDQLIEGMAAHIRHLQSEPRRLSDQVKYLESENRKMRIVLTRGYGYDLSLLAWQKESDFS